MNTHEWLLTIGRKSPTSVELLVGLCERLNEAGLDLLRVGLVIRTLHPQVEVIYYVWRAGGLPDEQNPPVPFEASRTITAHHGTVQESAVANGLFTLPGFTISPIRLVFETKQEIRRRIAADAVEFEFPILKDLHEVGATDYVIRPMDFGRGPMNAASFATRKVGGFTEEDLALLRSIEDTLALCIEAHASQTVTRTLMRTYAGANAAERILAGRIRRGDVEEIDAAIWFCDLRGFTTLSGQVPARELIADINSWFDVVDEAITPHGGEILKFIGDSILAVFPMTADRNRAAVCASALNAARAADKGLARLNEQRAALKQAELRHGIGLHVGTVQFGNIGARQRLDFTVIGAAVNLASRIEGMCGKLGRSALGSQDFAQATSAGLTPVGEFPLKGIDAPQTLYALD